MWAVCSDGDAPPATQKQLVCYTPLNGGPGYCHVAAESLYFPRHPTHYSDSRAKLRRAHSDQTTVPSSPHPPLNQAGAYSLLILLAPCLPPVFYECSVLCLGTHSTHSSHSTQQSDGHIQGPPETSDKEIDDVQSSASQTGTLAAMWLSGATIVNIKHYPGALFFLTAPGAKPTSSILKQKRIYNEQQ